MINNRKALAGIRIVDFSWAGIGPLTARHLAHHGAEVVKVESTTRPDVMRLLRPAKDGFLGEDLDRSGWLAQFNTNKYGITLNMKHPKALGVMKKLLSVTDVVLDNFSSGVMEKWGLGYDEVSKLKADIIMISLSMMGQTGRFNNFRGRGYHLAAMVGISDITGWPDRNPVGHSRAYTDFLVPHFGAIAVLAALAYRLKTGKGQYIDLAQREAALFSVGPSILEFTTNGKYITRAGNRLHYQLAAPHNVYKCAGEERWCAISVFNDQEWNSLCQVMGNPDWCKKPEFSTLLDRDRNRDQLDQNIEEWTSKLPAEKVMTLLQEAGIPAGVVNNPKDMLNDPQLKARNHFWELDHKVLGKHYCQGPGFKLSKTPAELTMPAPLIGEHNDYIYTKLVALSDEEFAELVVSGTFE